MRVLVLYNPAAGRSPVDREGLLELMRGFGYEAVWCDSKAGNWREALDGSFELLVAAGGDGTVAKLGRTEAARHVPIAVLPLGTANNIAATLHPGTRRIADLIAGWNDAERRPFDIGVARGPWGTSRFLESVGVGLLAAMMSEIETSGASINAIEDANLRLAAARSVGERVLTRLAPVELELTIDNKRLSGRFALVEALNFGAAGPNLKLTPTGDFSDGLLDVVIVEDAERTLLLDHLQHGEASPNSLRVLKGRHVTLHCAACELHLDDKLKKGDLDVELTVESGALTFLVPRQRLA